MATNNFFYKSLSDLKILAESYKTRVIPALEMRQNPSYVIDDISKQEFDNITNFLYNSVVKDSKAIERNESDYSSAFSKYLIKYFEEKLTLEDIIGLKELVNNYNGVSFNYFFNNIYKYVYGVGEEQFGTDVNTYYGKVINIIKDKILYLIGRSNVQGESHTLKYWLGEAEEVGAALYTAKEFFDNFLAKNNTIEAIVMLTIISYLNSEDIMIGSQWIDVTTPGSGQGTLYTSIKRGTWDEATTTIVQLDEVEANQWFSTSDSILYTNTIDGLSYKTIPTTPLRGLLIPTSNTTIGRDSNISLRKEQYFLLNEDSIKIDTNDFVFENEYSQLIYQEIDNTVGRKKSSLIIKDYYNRIMLSLPYQLTNLNETTVFESYNIFSGLSSKGTISFERLLEQLRNNIYGFIDRIKKTTTDLEYNSYLNFFVELGENFLVKNLNSFNSEIAKTFYTKDRVLDNFYVTSSEPVFELTEVTEASKPTLIGKEAIVESGRIILTLSNIDNYMNRTIQVRFPKLSANITEINKMQSQEQIVFIDVKGVDFSSSKEMLAKAKLLFSEELGRINLPESEDVINRLTYTVMYKELNPILRQVMLADIQEYVFARLYASFNYDNAFFFEANKKGLSFLDSLNLLYKNYKETKEVFAIDTNFSRYKFFYGNIYQARKSDESEIIGYYIGDNSSESSFLNNYGRRDYEKVEIRNFLNIYKTTRDYYYRVLLNKSFINDDLYPLYEKLFIGFVAVERFISSKISNLKDPDYFNSTDIFNFLESYGLGVLNQYNFFLGSKDYKTSIIKNFNRLTKLKGSKDVVDLLMNIFEVGDVSIEINKFLLTDETQKVYDEAGILPIYTVTSGNPITTYTFYLAGTPAVDTGIKAYDKNRLYFHQNYFKSYATGEWANVSVSSSYVFDDENYVLYQRTGSNSGPHTLVEKQFTFTNGIPTSLASGEIVYNELNETFYTGVTPSAITSISRSSIVKELPTSVLNETIYYVEPKKTFYTKKTTGWETFKVNDYYPTIIQDNINKGIITEGYLSESLSRYDGFTFYTSDDSGNILLKKYSYFSNTLITLDYIKAQELPKEPYVLNVPFWRLLIKQGYITRKQLEEYTPMIYRLKSNNVESNRVFMDIRDYTDKYFSYNAGTVSAPIYIYIQPTASIALSELKFVEVPYTSENGTREILNKLNSGVKYNNFLERNEVDKIDPYWTKENVPEELLKSEKIGIDTVETKYLSLTISENIYRRYTISRYALSAIEYLEDVFKITGEPESVISKIEIESGGDLFGTASIYDFFQAIKILFKTLLKLYTYQINDHIKESSSPSFGRFFGINGSYNFSSITELLGRQISNFSSISSEFLNDKVRSYNAPNTEVNYNKFNLYKKTNDWVSFDNNVKQYRKDLNNLSGTVKELNDVSRTLRSKIYSTHKLDSQIDQENSGSYVLRLFEDLNTIRIKEGDNLWNYFLSKFSDLDYTPAPSVIPQILAKEPDKSELYFKIIERMILMPIEYMDGLLNSAYIAQNVNMNKEFVELIETVFRDVYTVEGNKVWKSVKIQTGVSFQGVPFKGNYRYNSNSVQIYNGTIWVNVAFKEGEVGLSNPLSVEVDEYFLNKTNETIYLGTSGSPDTWQPITAQLGELFFDTVNSKLYYYGYEDPAFFTKKQFDLTTSSQDLITFLSEPLGILNNTSEIPVAEEELQELIENYSEKLFTAIESLRSIFSSEQFLQFSFSLKQNEQQTLGFVETAIKIFLSYTAQLYSSAYRREYKTISESVPLSEAVLHTLNSNKVSYVFYDEKLEVEKEV